MLFLIDDEIKVIRDERHLPLIVLDIIVLHLLKQLLHSRFAQELDERLVFRITFIRPEQEHTSVFFISLSNKFLRLVQKRGNQGLLAVVESLDIWFELNELLVVAPWYRTGNNQRSSGIIYQDGIDLIDNGKVMFALNKVVHCHGHIVTQVVEAEFVVGTESDVAGISLLPGIAVRLMFVYTIYRKSMEHIQRTHPLRVTF